MDTFNLKNAVDKYSTFFAEGAKLFRSIAWEIEKEPDAIQNYYDHPILEYLVSDQNSSCLERTIMLEALAYGDAGTMLACPGPSLSGQMLRELGTVEQKEMFFDFVRKTKARTCLAVTEPDKGSDAANMQMRVVKDINNKGHYFLTGQKWLVGNGACATIGTIVARSGSGPLGIIAILLTPSLFTEKGVTRSKLPMAGLIGTQLAHLSFENVPITEENILGGHLRATQRGMAALVKTFNRMRPCVGALAIGMAQAVIDYISDVRENLSHRDLNKVLTLNAKIATARELLHQSAKQVDADIYSSDVISLAKMNATHIVEEVVSESFSFFGPGAYFEHPLLAKWYRDAFAFEYMEGTTDMHKKNIAHGFITERRTQIEKYCPNFL